jgi:hypothetical protein
MLPTSPGFSSRVPSTVICWSNHLISIADQYSPSPMQSRPIPTCRFTTSATTGTTCAATSSLANRCATSSTRPAGFDRPSLRPGRKIDSTPETGRLITNKMRQIKCLRNLPAARSGRTLREADRPLREGAGTQKPSMRSRRSFHRMMCESHIFLD